MIKVTMSCRWSQVVEHLPNLNLIPSDEKTDHIFPFLCFSSYSLIPSHFARVDTHHLLPRISHLPSMPLLREGCWWALIHSIAPTGPTSSLSKAFCWSLNLSVCPGCLWDTDLTLSQKGFDEFLHTGIGKTHGQVHEVVQPGSPVA